MMILDNRHTEKGREFRSKLAKQLELPPCPFCGYSTFNAYGIEEIAFLPLMGQRVQIIRCNTCGATSPPAKSVVEAGRSFAARYTPEETADPEPDDLETVFTMVREVIEATEKEGGIAIEGSNSGIALFALQIASQYKAIVLEQNLGTLDLRMAITELVTGGIMALSASMFLDRQNAKIPPK